MVSKEEEILSFENGRGDCRDARELASVRPRSRLPRLWAAVPQAWKSIPGVSRPWSCH